MIDVNEYIFKETINLKNLGKVNILLNKNDSNDKIFEKIEYAKNEEEFNKLTDSKIKRYNFDKNINIINNLGYNFIKEKLMVITYFEYFNKTLFNLKKKNKIKFNSNFVYLEFLNLIKDICNSIKFLQQNDLIHGDIRLSNIMVIDNNKIEKIFKLIDRIDYPFSPDKLQLKYLKDKKRKIYLSPELLNQINKNKKSNNEFNNEFEYNPYKSEIFSLGLVALELLIDEKINLLYNKKNNSFNEDNLIDILEDIKKKDEDLFFILINMLHLSEEERKYPEEMIEIIEFYLESYKIRKKDIGIQCDLEYFDNDNFIYIYEDINDKKLDELKEKTELDYLLEKIENIKLKNKINK